MLHLYNKNVSASVFAKTLNLMFKYVNEFCWFYPVLPLTLI